MKKIEPADAFLMFRMWAGRHSPLQVNIRKPDGKCGASPCEITPISEAESKMSVLILFARRSQEWKIDFSGAIFSLGKPEDSAAFPEFAESKWVRYLLAELPNGGSYLFAEKRVDGTSAPR